MNEPLWLSQSSYLALPLSYPLPTQTRGPSGGWEQKSNAGSHQKESKFSLLPLPLPHLILLLLLPAGGEGDILLHPFPHPLFLLLIRLIIHTIWDEVPEFSLSIRRILRRRQDHILTPQRVARACRWRVWRL